MNPRLVVVEDDPTIREIVADRLKTEGFEVSTYASAQPLMEKTPAPAELYIIDIMLQGEQTGLDLCRKLRADSPMLPILILSALSEPSDRIEGLRSGADDYLGKPFEMEELLLRVSSMLRRTAWYERFPSNRTEHEWDHNRINFKTGQGSHGAESFVLGQRECMILKLLIEREGDVVSRDEILDQVWGYAVFPSARTVDNFIVRLRKAFEEEPSRPKYFHSVRGLGYKFTSGKG